MAERWNSIKEEVLDLEKEIFPKAVIIFKKYFPSSYRPDLVSELLRETSLTVIKKKEKGLKIENLTSYYIAVFENKIRNFTKNKTENAKNIDDVFRLNDLPDEKSPLNEIEVKILIKEIIKQMSKEVRFIFEMKLLGYDYEQIQYDYNLEFNVKIHPSGLRQKFRREIIKLANALNDSYIAE